MSDLISAHETRLREALNAYPQGHSGDDRGKLLVKVYAEDLRMLLGDIGAYRKTWQAIEALPVADQQVDGDISREQVKPAALSLSEAIEQMRAVPSNLNENSLAELLADRAADDEIPSTTEGWRPIESAPRDGTWVLIACDEVYRARYDEPHDLWHFDVDGCAVDPTHWQPLPSPPSEQVEGKTGSSSADSELPSVGLEAQRSDGGRD